MPLSLASIPADRRYTMFLAMVHLGALGTLLLIATLLFDLPSFVDGLPIGLLLVAIATIMHRRLRDDYVETLWHAGIAAAFVAVLASFLLAPLVFGIQDDIVGGETAWRGFEIRVQWPAAIALLGFYTGFYHRMLMGSGA